MNKSQQFQVLSPDGFTIEHDPYSYNSEEEAKIALKKWMQRYNEQGYYSSNNGRIPLDELEANCQIKPL